MKRHFDEKALRWKAALMKSRLTELWPKMLLLQWLHVGEVDSHVSINTNCKAWRDTCLI